VNLDYPDVTIINSTSKRLTDVLSLYLQLHGTICSKDSLKPSYDIL